MNKSNSTFDPSLSSGAARGSREFLIFQLADEEYAIDILKIQEIKQYDGVIHIANSPNFIPGVMRLNDDILPLVDLRIMFKLPPCQHKEVTMVIILNLLMQRKIGVLVDSVSDVITLDNSKIKSTPEFVTTIHNDYIEGVGLMDKRALIVLDIEKLFSVVELNAFDVAISSQRL